MKSQSGFGKIKMSDMIKFINTQNPRIDCFQAQTTQIDLKFQAIRIQQEILHSHDDKTFIISPRLLTAICLMVFYGDSTSPTTHLIK